MNKLDLQTPLEDLFGASFSCISSHIPSVVVSFVVLSVTKLVTLIVDMCNKA